MGEERSRAVISIPRLRFQLTGGKWIFGGPVLEIEDCGCKHVGVFLGLFILRIDFGVCRMGRNCDWPEN